MSLIDIVNTIHADPLLMAYDSPVRGAMAVEGTLGGSGTSSHNIVPPAIIWVPTTDSFGPPNLQGVRPASLTGGTPRAIRTRIVGVEAHIHAERTPIGDASDFATCEELLNRLCFAIHRVAGTGSYRFVSGGFLGVDGSGYLDDRCVYVLRLEFDVPVYEPTGSYTTATIASTPLSGGMTFADGHTVGPSTPPP